MNSLSRDSRLIFDEDIFKEISHKRFHEVSVSKFIFAFDFWAKEIELFRSQYTSLREVLNLLQLNLKLSKLSKSLSILKSWTKAQMLLLSIRKKNISFIAEKLSSSKKNLKTVVFSSFSSSSATTRFVFTKDLCFFDARLLFVKFIFFAEIQIKLHFEFEHFTESFIELWHFEFWTSFIRATFDQYVHLEQNSIFSLNFIVFKCSMINCQCQIQSSYIHSDRVSEIDLNYRKSIVHSSVVTLKMQKILQLADISVVLVSFMKTSKFIIVENQFFYFQEEQMSAFIKDVHLNYFFFNRVQNQNQQSIRRSDHLFVRRVYNSDMKVLRSLCQTHFIREELKLSIYTRQHFVQNFDKSKFSSVRCVSLSLLTFIDEFELYCNMYKTLMSMYVMFAAFSFRERTRQVNVLSLTLESHESNFFDVIAVLRSSLTSLERDELLKLNDKQKIFLCVFILSFLEDMSQQNENFEMMNQRVNLECRFCFIHVKKRDNVKYDITKNDPFHHEILKMRKKMNSINKIQQDQYCQDIDLNSTTSLLFTITSILDIIRTRSSDICKFKDDRKLSHQLMSTLMTLVWHWTFERNQSLKNERVNHSVLLIII